MGLRKIASIAGRNGHRVNAEKMKAETNNNNKSFLLAFNSDL